MQITAFIFDQLFYQFNAKNKINKRELTYCPNLDGKIRFKLGGEGFFSALIA